MRAERQDMDSRANLAENRRRTLTLPAAERSYRPDGKRLTSVEPMKLAIPEDKIAEFRGRHPIRKLALFGSAPREDFRPENDIDVLVEFEPGARVGLIRLAGMELELSEILGRKVDLNTPRCLSPHFRERAVAEAQTLHERT